MDPNTSAAAFSHAANGHPPAALIDTHAALLLTICALLLTLVYLLASSNNQKLQQQQQQQIPAPALIPQAGIAAPSNYWQHPGFGWTNSSALHTPPNEINDPHNTQFLLQKLASSPPSMMAPTMEEAAGAHQESVPRPVEVLQELKAGNTRFWTGTANRPELSAMERRALIVQQSPKVAVIGCADSRVPVEIILDQGLGDVFVMRTAGNLYVDTTAGSLDYAVHKLHVPLVVVMGHEGCGAVSAATRMSEDQLEQQPPNLKALVRTIQGAISRRSSFIQTIVDPRARDREAVCTVVRRQVKSVLEDPLIQQRVKDGQLLVVGAFYEISSGLVDFYEYSEAELEQA